MSIGGGFDFSSRRFTFSSSMSVLKSLLNRDLVGRWSKQKVDFSTFIEDFHCHQDDCHSIQSVINEFAVPPISCGFCKMPGYEHILAVADEDGSLRIMNTNVSGIQCSQEHWIAHGNAIFDIAWLNSEPQLLTASGDQTAVLWNVEPVVKIATFEGHSCSLKSISCRSDDKFVFSTCARDGNIMIWDTRCNKRDTHYTPVNIIHSAHVNVASTTPKQRKKVRLCNTKPASDSQQSVIAVVFQDENTLISAGAMDGSIKMWDLRKNYKRMNKEPMPKHVFPYAGSSARKRGFSNLLLNSTRSCVFASCTDDIIYQYDCAGLCTSPVARYTGHLNSTFYVKAALSSDDNYLLSGSSDDTAYIWQVGKSEKPVFRFKGHSSEVTCVAWNHQDFSKLVTCSDDNTVKVWKLDRTNIKGDTNKNGWCEKYPQVSTSQTGNEPLIVEGIASQPSASQPSTPRSSAGSYFSSHDHLQSPLSANSAPCSPVSNVPKISQHAMQPATPPQNENFRKYISPKLKNSSIKQWFCSPRVNKKEPNEFSQKKKSRDSPFKENENISNCLMNGTPRGVKRKIENDAEFSKKELKSFVDDEIVVSNGMGILEQHLASVDNLNNKSCQVTEHDKDHESLCDKETPIKDAARHIHSGKFSAIVCGSPTMNLPNIVLDSPTKLGVPISQLGSDCDKENNTLSKPRLNWLTEICKQKRLQGNSDIILDKNSPGKRLLVESGGFRNSLSKDSSSLRCNQSSPKVSKMSSPKSPMSPNCRCIRTYFHPVHCSNGVEKSKK